MSAAKFCQTVCVVSAALFPLLAAPAAGPRGQRTDQGRGLVITLKNDFIDKYRDRVTIDTDFTVDQVGKIHPPKEDGDLHFSGRAEEVQLPIVAEIMNAKEQAKAATLLNKSKGKKVKLSGVWRLWCEHGGTKAQVQGEDLEPFEESNPDHVFEIHPVTKLGSIATMNSFHEIKGYRPKDAHAAFVHYENIRCEITPEEGKTTLVTRLAGYNIVDFILEVAGDQREVEDGRMVICDVLDTDGELLVRNRRMVFVKGTEPEKRVKDLEKGGRLRVLGLPRIDLSLVKWRVDHKDDERKPLTWNLPYEMVVLAALPNNDND